MQRSTIDCGYVIMDSQSRHARQTLLDWLATERIFSIGRYGGWSYGSMESAMVDGRQAAKRIGELP